MREAPTLHDTQVEEELLLPENLVAGVIELSKDRLLGEINGCQHLSQRDQLDPTGLSDAVHAYPETWVEQAQGCVHTLAFIWF